MENKHVGWLVIGIVVVLVGIIFLFSNTLKGIVNSSCSLAHGDATSCPMYKSINEQTYLALGISGLLMVLGVILIFSKPQEKIIIKKIKPEKGKKIDVTDLRPEDKIVYKIVEEQGTIFQADLIEKTEFGKAKMSRIIDRLEGRGLVERKRRGMTNVVVLKEN
jgi:hypothetical protein